MTNFSFMFIIVSIVILFIFKLLLLYLGCAGFSLLQRPFSSCGECWLFSGCGAWASHCSGLFGCGAWALGGFPGGSAVKNPPGMQKTQVRPLSQEDSLEVGMAIHSSALAWRISWTEEPGRLWSRRSYKVGHD